MIQFLNLSGKTALITGAGSGIGRAIAVRLAQANAKVIAWDITFAGAQETVEMIQAAGGQATVGTLDVTDATAVNEAIANLADAGGEFGNIDILVNCAGIASIGNVEQTPPEELDRVLKVNVSGVANTLRAVVPQMAARGAGAIVNIASIASLIGLKDRFAYSASKGAVLTMTYSVAIDYAHRGVRCNCVCPARIHTPFVDGYLAKNYPDNKEEMFQKLSAYQPIGRMGKPEEVAALVHFLVSDDATFITGAAYPIDGGLCAMPGYS